MHLAEQKYASGVMSSTSFEKQDQLQPLCQTGTLGHFFHKPWWWLSWWWQQRLGEVARVERMTGWEAVSKVSRGENGGKGKPGKSFEWFPSSGWIWIWLKQNICTTVWQILQDIMSVFDTKKSEVSQDALRVAQNDNIFNHYILKALDLRFQMLLHMST